MTGKTPQGDYPNAAEWAKTIRGPVAPDSLAARLREHWTNDRASIAELHDLAADRIEQLQRDVRDAKIGYNRIDAELKAAESRLARITQALTELVTCNEIVRRGDGKTVRGGRWKAAWTAASDAIRHTTEG